MARFNSANAREMAARSHEARKEAAAAKALAAANAALAPQAAPQTAVDEFLVDRLVRVRRQLDRIDTMMSREEDPQRRPDDSFQLPPSSPPSLPRLLMFRCWGPGRNVVELLRGLAP